MARMAKATAGRQPRPARRLRPPRNAVVAEIVIEVPFHDVDAMGVVWHGNYLRYFERARTALERRLDLSFQTVADLGFVCPIVESHCRHVSALRFGDMVRCRAWVAHVDRTFTIGYELIDETTRQRAAEGYTVQVALRRDTMEMVLELPDEMLDRVRSAGIPVDVVGSGPR